MKFKFKEIMCTDIYTDINEYYKAYNINSDQIDDLKNIYLKLYYPLINSEIFNNIWKLLSNSYSIEDKIISDYIIDSNNSYSLDYPVRLYLKILQNENYTKYVNDVYIIQSIFTLNTSV